MSPSLISTFDNEAWLNREMRHKTSTLSVLIPFYKDDPRALLSQLASAAPKGVEFILFDDGLPDQQLNLDIQRTLKALITPARLITAQRNQGRAAARNFLAHNARAPWVLYLDSDMEIPGAFLHSWIDWSTSKRADVYYGGFDMPHAIEPEHKLHAALALAGDVEGAETRDLAGPHGMASSNLLVRRDILMSTPFDENFVGWGWEDVDWALRADAYATLLHVDLPARHKGLQSVDTLLAKFEEGGINYARFVARHPAALDRPIGKATKLLKQLPFLSLQKSLYAWEAKNQALPLKWRMLALKLYRAACHAQALKGEAS